MHRSSDYKSKRQVGWDTTSHDYHAHVARMERMPSILPDVPHYPNVHVIFNNKGTTYEEELPPKQQNEEVREKIEVVERVTEFDNKGNCEVYEESVDVEANGFIQQKRKGFELCKWKTFKVR